MASRQLNVFMTGANGGLGRETARLLLADGAHKVVMAQKADLEAKWLEKIESKMKSELLSDHDRSSNLKSLRSEMDTVRGENDRLKVALSAMKELHQKSVAEKDGDVLELNTVINALKRECEELRALQVLCCLCSKSKDLQIFKFIIFDCILSF